MLAALPGLSWPGCPCHGLWNHGLGLFALDTSCTWEPAPNVLLNELQTSLETQFLPQCGAGISENPFSSSMWGRHHWKSISFLNVGQTPLKIHFLPQCGANIIKNPFSPRFLLFSPHFSFIFSTIFTFPNPFYLKTAEAAEQQPPVQRSPAQLPKPKFQQIPAKSSINPVFRWKSSREQHSSFLQGAHGGYGVEGPSGGAINPGMLGKKAN